MDLLGSVQHCTDEYACRSCALDYEMAIEHYTEAIELCPPEQEAEAAPFYCNRAACHIKLVLGGEDGGRG